MPTKTNKKCPGPDPSGPCPRPVFSRGLCSTHLRQAQRGEELHEPRRYVRQEGPCAGPECDRDAIQLGLCNAHLLQHRRGKELHPIGQRPEPKPRQQRPARQPREPREPRQQRERKPEPAAQLPAGWHKTRAKQTPSPATTKFSDDVMLLWGSLPPLDNDTLAAASRCLVRHDATDLADMLGLTLP